MSDDGWTDKQLEQFLRIRNGYIKTGFDQETAELHAARAINAQPDRRAGRRPNPEPTKDELYQEAVRYDIAGRSMMDKEELAKAVAGVRESRRSAS